MKITFKIFTLLLIGILYVSCGDEGPDDTTSKEGTIELAMKVTYDGEPLILFNEYDYPDGKKMIFSRFSFYMSDLTLRTEETTASTDVVSYVRLGAAHNTDAGAAEGYKFNLNGVQSADYVNLSFGIGVPPDLNSMKPADFLSSNDLSLGEHWPDWNSYIFCKVEGRIDFDNDGVPETDFALHLGADEAFVDIEIDRDFTVSVDSVTEVTLPVELKNFFIDNGSIYDIESNPKIHSLSQQAQVFELARNLKTCF